MEGLILGILACGGYLEEEEKLYEELNEEISGITRDFLNWEEEDVDC